MKKPCKPTPGEPSGYIARGDWMEDRYKRGLIQLRCPKCKLWHIWVRATKANKRLNDQQQAEMEAGR